MSDDIAVSGGPPIGDEKVSRAMVLVDCYAPGVRPADEPQWWALCFHPEHGVPESLYPAGEEDEPDPDPSFPTKAAAKAAARAHRDEHKREDAERLLRTCSRCGTTHTCVGPLG